ncbi:MAG TPA: hypothetical protein DCP92_16790 [Nitrospiraceae bacterium]|nr:hypothetical protein [Nitrospiraceae bacterium]
MGSATLPQKRLRRIRYLGGGEGWVAPFGDSLSGGGASEGGFQRGKPRRGRSGTVFVFPAVEPGRAGDLKQSPEG